VSEDRKKTIRKIESSLRQYGPRVRRKLARAGRKPDRAIVFAVAKYYEALDKLAKE